VTSQQSWKKRRKNKQKEKKCALGHRSVKIQILCPTPKSPHQLAKLEEKKEKAGKPLNWGRDVQRTQFHNPAPTFPNQLSVHPATFETRQCTPLQYGGR